LIGFPRGTQPIYRFATKGEAAARGYYKNGPLNNRAPSATHYCTKVELQKYEELVVYAIKHGRRSPQGDDADSVYMKKKKVKLETNRIRFLDSDYL